AGNRDQDVVLGDLRLGVAVALPVVAPAVPEPVPAAPAPTPATAVVLGVVVVVVRVPVGGVATVPVFPVAVLPGAVPVGVLGGVLAVPLVAVTAVVGTVRVRGLTGPVRRTLSHLDRGLVRGRFSAVDAALARSATLATGRVG